MTSLITLRKAVYMTFGCQNVLSVHRTSTYVTFRSLGAHAHGVSDSVKSHLTSGVSVCPQNTVTYSASNGSPNIFSETAPLERSRNASLKVIRLVGHFPTESAHAHYS